MGYRTICTGGKPGGTCPSEGALHACCALVQAYNFSELLEAHAVDTYGESSLSSPFPWVLRIHSAPSVCAVSGGSIAAAWGAHSCSPPPPPPPPESAWRGTSWGAMCCCHQQSGYLRTANCKSGAQGSSATPTRMCCAACKPPPRRPTQAILVCSCLETVAQAKLQ